MRHFGFVYWLTTSAMLLQFCWPLIRITDIIIHHSLSLYIRSPVLVSKKNSLLYQSPPRIIMITPSSTWSGTDSENRVSAYRYFYFILLVFYSQPPRFPYGAYLHAVLKTCSALIVVHHQIVLSMIFGLVAHIFSNFVSLWISTSSTSLQTNEHFRTHSAYLVLMG